jgi:hypothetical protein
VKRTGTASAEAPSVAPAEVAWSAAGAPAPSSVAEAHVEALKAETSAADSKESMVWAAALEASAARAAAITMGFMPRG